MRWEIDVILLCLFHNVFITDDDVWSPFHSSAKMSACSNDFQHIPIFNFASLNLPQIYAIQPWNLNLELDLSIWIKMIPLENIPIDWICSFSWELEKSFKDVYFVDVVVNAVWKVLTTTRNYCLVVAWRHWWWDGAFMEEDNPLSFTFFMTDVF